MSFRDILTSTGKSLREDGNVLSALAGLFLFLPITVMLWLVLDSDQMRAAEGPLTPDQMTAFMADRGLWLIPFALIPLLGQLSISAFLLDPERPTAGGAIVRASKLFLPYLAVVLLIQIGFQLLAGLLMVLGTVGQLLLIVAAVYVAMRLFLLTPGFAAGGKRVLSALKESWRLTSGDFWKLFLPFVFGIAGAFFLGAIALSLIILPARAFFGTDGEIVASAFATGLLLAALSLYSHLFAVSAYRMRRRND